MGSTDFTAMVSSGAALAWLLVVAIALVAHGESEEIQTLRSVSLGESADMEEYTTDIGATSRFLSKAKELIRAQADRLLSQKMVSAAKFTKLTPNGYCVDWAYPTGTRSGGYDNDSTTAAQCLTRCVAQLPGTTSFYLKGTQCGCSSGKTGACSVKAHAGYTSYEITLTKAQKIAAKRITDACEYHLGLAAKSWMKPYRKAVLDPSLRNIMHNEVRVDCNPASCDNPRVCGIPPCSEVTRTDHKKARNKKRCPAAKGCGI